MGFSRQEYWRELPFPSPVGHVVSEVFTLSRLSQVALHSTTKSFIELQYFGHLMRRADSLEKTLMLGKI